jgi:hypothetical protein
MVKKLTKGREMKPRFTVTLDPEEYDSLVTLARHHHPRLSLRYVVQFAVRQLLARVKRDPQLALDLGDPTVRRED